MEADFVHLLAEWLITWQGQGIDGFYETGIWADMKNMVHQFLSYMENDAGIYSTSCNDKGWWKERNTNWHNADDKVVCKMMVPALFFMNGWGTSADGGYDASAVGTPLHTYIRCIIVNVFMFQLMKANCGRNHGIRQALHIFEPFMASVPNAVNPKMCTWVVSNELKVGGRVIGAQFDDWIMGNEKMKAKMNKLQQRVKCNRPGTQTSDNGQASIELLKPGPLRAAMEKGMTPILKKVRKKVGGVWGEGAADDDDEDDDDDDEDDDEEDDEDEDEDAEQEDANGKKSKGTKC
ncbi:hypothetical protein AK88_05641 [Plasmodium fragile]|uniref:Schizont-infected cell agglutination extracellular alpha domain-containing protein n=1 Tax=Plasmodium fragile TaxID=5857 RepID=A0A0D9QCJ9_PLAFR|nr:uncharacterized protein AK88_05641 [Plasmodium fragile]KJP84728.1 hypothetical protein AK88_05641 [Plasmodium fragile]